MPGRTIAEIVAELGSFIPFDKSAAWDVAGLQLGDPQSSAESIAVCHEVTEDVVSRVEQDRPDLVLTYHPLIFRATRSLVGGRSPGGRAFRLIRAGTGLVVAHTAWDVAPGGAADALAQALGVADPSPFGLSEGAEQIKVVTFVPEGDVARLVAAMSAAGGGTIGHYEGCHFTVNGRGGFVAGDYASPVVGESGHNAVAESRVEMIAPAGRRDAVVSALVGMHPYEEPAFDVYPVEANSSFIGRVGTLQTSLAVLVDEVESVLGTSTRTAGARERPVGRVAVVPGSGGSLIGAAASAGADVIVTGDVSHHTMVEANDRRMAVIDAGHAATERPGIAALVSRVIATFSSRVPVFDYRDLDPNPWQ